MIRIVLHRPLIQIFEFTFRCLVSAFPANLNLIATPEQLDTGPLAQWVERVIPVLGVSTRSSVRLGWGSVFCSFVDLFTVKGWTWTRVAKQVEIFGKRALWDEVKIEWLESLHTLFILSEIGLMSFTVGGNYYIVGFRLRPCHLGKTCFPRLTACMREPKNKTKVEGEGISHNSDARVITRRKAKMGWEDALLISKFVWNCLFVVLSCPLKEGMVSLVKDDEDLNNPGT